MTVCPFRNPSRPPLVHRRREHVALKAICRCDQLQSSLLTHETRGPLGRVEKSRADPTVSLDRFTRPCRYNVIARYNFNVPQEVSLQHLRIY
ncbi:hypothetical protein EVAR_11175_1 [Eumeta japonica]|uniref:Uncharacterized protein n=1 Tax=Eumeta variegata TaxID=151549 RepID=A0A4C1U590_EUMVA|nr:hypothetical protein EVAR_11175_1 [Eumeta japonica]